MAVVATQPLVDVSATLIAQNTAADDQIEGDFRARVFLVKNLTGGDVFLGGNTVTTATGFKWSASDGVLTIELEPGEALYGIGTTPQQLHVLRTGR
jgi:hypothetical protein